MTLVTLFVFRFVSDAVVGAAVTFISLPAVVNVAVVFNLLLDSPTGR